MLHLYTFARFSIQLSFLTPNILIMHKTATPKSAIQVQQLLEPPTLLKGQKLKTIAVIPIKQTHKYIHTLPPLSSSFPPSLASSPLLHHQAIFTPNSPYIIPITPTHISTHFRSHLCPILLSKSVEHVRTCTRTERKS